jgi:thymidylate kinase
MSRTPLAVAARIVAVSGEIDLSTMSPGEIESAAKTLLEQKVSLLGLRERYGEVVDSTPLAGHIERDRAEYQRQRGEFERIRNAFGEDGVATMLFKSSGLYPSFHYLSSNLDVIVPDGRSDQARKRLVDLGYVELLNVEEPKKFLFRRFPGDGTSVAFHLHEVVGWGVPFVDNDSLWKNARPADDDPDILIPGPEEALLVTLAHWFYEDKQLSLGNLLATECALGRLHLPLSEVGEAAARFGWEEGYWAALEVADIAWRDLYGTPLLGRGRREEVDEGLSRHRSVAHRLLPKVTYGGREPARMSLFQNKVIYYRKILRDPSRSVWRRTRDVAVTLLWAVRWKLHVRSQHPLLVSISGCDGSGKTLQAERLERVLRTCDLRVKVLWARGASSRFMGAFIRLGKRFRGDDRSNDAPETGEEQKMESRRQSLQNPLLRFGFNMLYALDIGWIYCVKTRWWLWTGNVVIADRYVYDGLVDFALLSGRPIDRLPFFLRWVRRLSPKPAVRILLDVDPQEALRRKPEEGGTAHLIEALNAFRTLADGGGFEIFADDWAPEEINRRLAMMSLERFYERYGTVVNWLLWSNPSQLNPRQRGARA